MIPNKTNGTYLLEIVFFDPILFPHFDFMSLAFQDLKSIWSCGALIPVPLTCKATALPSELQPLW